MTKRKKQKPAQIKNSDDVVKALEMLFATKYINKKKLYSMNFLRGMAFGAGSVIGAALIIAVLAWVLSWFEEVPLLGPITETIQNTLESQTQLNN